MTSKELILLHLNDIRDAILCIDDERQYKGEREPEFVRLIHQRYESLKKHLDEAYPLQ